MIRRLGLAVLLLAGMPAPGAAGEELDLAAVVRLALERNPALKAAEERRREVEGGVREVRADALPQLAFTSGWSRSRSPALLNSPDFEEFIKAFPGGSFEPREQELYGLALEASQPIFTWGKIGAAIDLARLVVEVTDRQIATARLDTALLAAEAYYDLLAAREALSAFEFQERSRRESLEVVEARFELGEATELERLQARAALAEVTPDVTQARGRIDVARLRLEAVLACTSRPPAADPGDSCGLDLDAAPHAAPAAAEAALAPALPEEALLEVAFERRPELVDLRLQDDALARQQVVTRAEGRPQIDLNGSYGRSVRLIENIDKPLFADWRVGVVLRWEFFDGGRRDGRIAQLESRRRQVGWQLEELRTRVELEVRQARSEYATARERLAAAQMAARAAREASRVAAESYREGVALQADWLDAQQREIQAEVLRVESYYDARIRAARLLRSLGLEPTERWTRAPARDGEGES